MRDDKVVGIASFCLEFQGYIIISVTDVLSLNAYNCQHQVGMCKVVECTLYMSVRVGHLNGRHDEIS